MKLIINDKIKKDAFISIFQLLKTSSSSIRLIFDKNYMYIQGMDKSHICLFDIKIFSSWFDNYELLENDISNISLCTQFFHNIISMTQDKHSLNIHYDNNPDAIFIDLICQQDGSDYNKYFRLPLTDYETESVLIPEVDYDAEFSISSKKFCELCSQLLIFGDVMNVKCNEDKIDLASTGVGGEMAVNIPIDDLSEFSISEGESINLSYSLNYIHKMCLTTKLSSEICLSISQELPLRIKYDLGSESYVTFFIAPRISDD
uniref:Proliferating cell nuclear antigen PCNA C-terminal domain-containing protein n=1 Tax=viral metagenome TaxID=1070528 RepID=A0A6C0KX24_9ZZZZ